MGREGILDVPVLETRLAFPIREEQSVFLLRGCRSAGALSRRGRKEVVYGSPDFYGILLLTKPLRTCRISPFFLLVYLVTTRCWS